MNGRASNVTAFVTSASSFSTRSGSSVAVAMARSFPWLPGMMHPTGRRRKPDGSVGRTGGGRHGRRARHRQGHRAGTGQGGREGGGERAGGREGRPGGARGPPRGRGEG